MQHLTCFTAQAACCGCVTMQVEYALTEDKRLRGNLRDPSAIEAQITALQVCHRVVTRGWGLYSVTCLSVLPL
jgi:hypothetical protein